MSLSQLLPPLDAQHPRSMADQVYDLLYERIINLTLPPGTKLSEAEVAAQLGVSRQLLRPFPKKRSCRPISFAAPWKKPPCALPPTSWRRCILPPCRIF
ncbi:GntR family transcriptional regulator [Roseinatronobacter sp.]|uniref:GntR family transcriptional regulator n=1 Tax=Roseinatronobacter sp. TaxID=1945755 RepID=UPI003F729C7B